MVAPGIPKIHLAVVDHGIRPVSHIKSSVRTRFHINRTETHVWCPHEIGHLFGNISRARIDPRGEIGNRKTDDPMRSKVVGDGVALPVSRKMRTVNQFQPTKLWIVAGAHRRHNLPRFFISNKLRTRKSPVNPLPASSIGEEALSCTIPSVPPRVHPPLRKDLRPLGSRVVRKASARVQSHHPPRRF